MAVTADELNSGHQKTLDKTKQSLLVYWDFIHVG
jgi:hypothetical protein